MSTRILNATALGLAMLYGMVGGAGEALHYLLAGDGRCAVSRTDGVHAHLHRHDSDGEWHFHHTGLKDQASTGQDSGVGTRGSEPPEHQCADVPYRHAEHGCALLALTSTLKLTLLQGTVDVSRPDDHCDAITVGVPTGWNAFSGRHLARGPPLKVAI